MLDISIDLPETISSLKSINNLSINISNENTDTEKPFKPGSSAKKIY